MRRSASLLIPLTLIFLYYAFWVGLIALLLNRFPGFTAYFPIGGMQELAAANLDSFEPVYSSMQRTVFAPDGALRLFFGTLGSIILTVPISWVYFITSRSRRINQSFLQTIIILPIVVTGISMIVLNSLALAFSLAGIVAAVRFRFSLSQPSDAMYIFVAIAIGLGAGIGALDIAAVTSFVFVLTTLGIWKLEYGKAPAGGFLTMLSRRDEGKENYE